MQFYVLYSFFIKIFQINKEPIITRYTLCTLAFSQTLDIDNWDFIAINIKNPIAKKCEFRYYDAEWDETVTGELIKKKYQKDSGISILLSNLDTYSNLVSTKGVIKPFAYLALSGFEDIMDKYKVNISREDMGFYE